METMTTGAWAASEVAASKTSAGQRSFIKRMSHFLPSSWQMANGAMEKGGHMGRPVTMRGFEGAKLRNDTKLTING
jgi:hypothetical protein